MLRQTIEIDGRRTKMGKVAMGLSMSLDGFIAGPNDGPDSPLGEGGERLFAWYSGGDTEYRLPGTEMVFNVSPQSAELLREAHSKMGAFVTGRRTFDITNGWGGSPPLGVPTFVVSHTVPQEWVDEIHVDLVPVLLGDGVRLFDDLGTGPIELESTQVVEASGVTHLTFRVVK
jgi:dihydrofolate reductase